MSSIKISVFITLITQIYFVLAENHVNNYFNYFSEIQNKELRSINFNFSSKQDLVILMNELFQYLLDNSNKTLLFETLFYNQDCFDSITTYNTQNGETEFNQMINYSGKSLLDNGLEDDCVIGSNLTYLFLTFKLNTSYVYSFDEYEDLYAFLDQDSFFIGLCLWRECNEFYQKFLQRSLNEKFFSKLEAYGVQNLSIYNMVTQESIAKNSDTPNSKENSSLETFTIYVWVFIIYISIRIVISFIDYIFYLNNSNDLNNDNNIEKSYINSSSDSIHEVSFTQLNNTDKNFLSNGNQKKSSKKDGMCYKFCRIISLRKTFQLLFKVKTKYHNESNLRILSGFRFFLFFFQAINQNLYSLTKMPHRNFGGYFFYSSFNFFIVKYAALIPECFAALNGVYLGYKLMMFIKSNQGFTIKHICIFYLKCISNFFVFIFSFFILHLNIKELGYLMGNMTIFDYIVNKDINSRACINNPKIIFIPFYLQYGVDNKEYSYDNCYRFVQFASSEFYCFTILLILFYLLNKIRSRKLDLFVFFLNILNLILVYFSHSHNLIGKNYIVNYIFGESITDIYPHIFFISYFFGVNVGIMWFYYNDLISSNPVTQGDKYFLFIYNFYIMKFLDQKSDNFKASLCAISVFLKILICSSFFIFLHIFSDTDHRSDILLKGNLIIELVFIYEGKIFTLLFLIFLVSFLLYSKESFIQKILCSKLFVPINRINYTFLSTNDFIVYVFYAIYNVQIYLTFQNSIFMSLALLVVILIFSFGFVLLLELPIRMIIRTIVNRINHPVKFNLILK